jgi:phosphatidylethanolamine-binding protein (PEBP) family uncharacterized protein
MASRTLLAVLLVMARAPLKLASNFGANQALPADHRGDEDNISPPISWSGAPKNAESFVLIVDSHDPASKCDGDDDSCGDAAGSPADAQAKGKKGTKGKKKKGGPKTHWLIYDIPKEVKELREELSGAGSSDVARLGMKEDAGQAPVVVDPMGQIDGWVDPEIKAMEDMIHSAVDMSFEDKNRAKEGKNSFGGTYYRGPSEEGMLATFKLYALSGRLDHLPRGASREEVIKAMKGKVLDKATLTAKIA